MAKFTGIPWDIVLQGFHWRSHDPAQNGGKVWYEIMRECAARIRHAGFTWVWFPPPSDSLSPEGYMPRRWYDFDTPFGTREQLREAIAALAPEARALADVVVNHRVGTAGLTDFTEPSFGPAAEDNIQAMVADDSCRCGTGGPDTGEHEPSSRDLDHANPKVRAKIVDYLHELMELGFRGWRFDLAKGYDGKFVGQYNAATLADGELSIGEYLDRDASKLLDWLDQTGNRSAVFDYPVRYLLRDAIRQDDFGPLGIERRGRQAPPGVMGARPTQAVTFLDNHDTEYRRGRSEHFLGNDVAVGYAYILTHPGIPCVFWPHFFDWDDATKRAIAALINLRHAAKLTSDSTVQIQEARRGLYAALVDGKVAVKIGTELGWSPGSAWTLVTSGDRFAVWRR
jgi:alpha-amylase